MTPTELIEAHRPSITEAVEANEDWPLDSDGEYAGDRRECRCGLMLDGFYEYVDHLKDVFRQAGHG